MGNILDYIHWRGDLSFQQDPFNEVDNMALCLLIYVNLDEMIGVSDGEYLSLKELSAQFFESYTEEELAKDKTFVRYAPYLMKEMAESVRYQDILLGNYVNVIDKEKLLQMSAACLKLPDGTVFVAYRGTDDRILSWKEDFMLAAGEVSAQSEAVSYLNEIGRRNPDAPLRIGGHSKGGHMAVYAGACCEESIQKRILKIYNNDGPGFRTEFLKSENYQKIANRITRLIPQESIVGMLLMHTDVPEILQSSGKNIMQHDGMTWEILGNKFLREDTISDLSQGLDRVMKEWMNNYSDEQRRSFINEVFSVLEASGAETMTELQQGGVQTIIAMKKQYSKTEHPEYQPQFETLDFCEYVKCFLGEKYEEIEISGFGLDLDISEEPILVELDPALFRRCLENLLTNALKYNPSGTTLSIAITADIENMNFIFADNGEGIAKDLQEHIFDSFVTGDRSRSGGNGTGLGLAITKKIVSLHKGQIELVVPPGKQYSTQFRIILPTTKNTNIKKSSYSLYGKLENLSYNDSIRYNK